MQSGSYTPARQALWFLVATSFATQYAQAGTSDLDAALEAWRAEHGASWLLDVDEKTGVGKLLYSGAAEAAFLPENDADFVSVAIGFVADTEALHGIDADMLVFERMAYLPLSLIDSTDKTTVKFQQEVNGVSVEAAYVNVLMDTDDGHLLSIQSTALPGLEEFDTQNTISAEEAIVLACEQLDFDTGASADSLSIPELVIAQIESEASRTPLLTWRVRASAGLVEPAVEHAPVSIIYHIDAKDGNLVRSASAISHFDVSGTVTSWITMGTEALTAASDVDLKPMSRMRIYASETAVNPIGSTNPDGTYSIDDQYNNTTIWFRYEGDAVFRIENGDGNEHAQSLLVFTGSGNDVEMNVAGTEEVTAQANAYYWLDYLYGWILEANPTDTIWDGFGNGTGDHRVACMVHKTAGYLCNGENDPRDGKVAFTDDTTCDTGLGCAAGLTCSNKSNATLIIHETGHILNRYYTGFSMSGALDEAAADVYALYVTDQPIIGVHWCYDSNNLDEDDLCVTRHGDNSRRDCRNSNPCYGNFGRDDADRLFGAFWKMRTRFKKTLGATNGSVAANILHNCWMNAYNETDISAAIRYHLLVLDDTDGSIANGTPHWADIDLGFVDQGFPASQNGISYTNLTDPTQTTDETGPYTVGATIVPNYGGPITAAKIHYRVNGGAFASPVSMTKTPFTNNWSGSIPGHGAPAVIEYYIAATDSMILAGQTSEYPTQFKVALDATPDQYSSTPDLRYDPEEATPLYRRFFVGAKDQLFFDDFESPPHTGWAHGGNEDDWEFGDPTGEPDQPIKWSDPDDAYSGTECVGNDLGTDDGEYEENANNWLRSPEIELPSSVAEGRTFLRFRRWLSCDQWNDAPSEGDIAQVHVISADPVVDEVVWKNHLFVYHVDGGWISVEIDITDVLEELNTIQIEWTLETNEDELAEFGGWSIDDVEVFTIYNP